MFSRHNKIKERILFFSENQSMVCQASKNQAFQPIGVSFVTTYRYTLNNIEIIYNKWVVESFELAKQMNLPGCEHHNKLVKGSGVLVSTKDLGTATFYGKDAMEIMDACEIGTSVLIKQR